MTFAANAQQAPAPSARGTPTTRVVKFHVKAGKNDEFEKAFREMQDGVRAHEPGNVYYDFFVDNTDPQLYVIVERYKDADAVAAHGKSDHAKKMLATIRDLMDGPPEFQRLILISAKQK
jgi:autoinducer 2-degrading protein